MSARPVSITSGASELRYVVITEQTGEDISSDVATVCISPAGVAPLPGAFQAPDVNQASTVTVNGQTLHVRTLGILVSAANAVAGRSYHVWGKLTDVPEVVPVSTPTAFPVI